MPHEKETKEEIRQEKHAGARISAMRREPSGIKQNGTGARLRREMEWCAKKLIEERSYHGHRREG